MVIVLGSRGEIPSKLAGPGKRQGDDVRRRRPSAASAPALATPTQARVRRKAAGCKQKRKGELLGPPLPCHVCQAPACLPALPCLPPTSLSSHSQKRGARPSRLHAACLPPAWRPNGSRWPPQVGATSWRPRAAPGACQAAARRTSRPVLTDQQVQLAATGAPCVARGVLELLRRHVPHVYLKAASV